MKKIIAILFIASFLTISPKVIADQSVPKTQKQLIGEYVHQYAEKYSINEKTLQQVISCESRGVIDAINYNDGGKGKHSVGILQFQKSTFKDWEKKEGEDLDYYSYHDQIKLGSYMIQQKQLHQWTCGKKLL